MAITAWETLFDRLDVNKPVAGGANALLLIGGAGGVGSLAIQLLKKLTDIQVIATASRPESRAWVKELGADFVINHHENMAERVAALNIGAPPNIDRYIGKDNCVARKESYYVNKRKI